METLIIKDLAVIEELDTKAMAAVHGGNDTPIKYDGLIGDGVLRESKGATSAYNAVPIQAFAGAYNGFFQGLESGVVNYDPSANVTGMIVSRGGVYFVNNR
ncbi:MAG: hypothetical protein ACREX0_14730 [Noviherbaspirillum sp.]